MVAKQSRCEENTIVGNYFFIFYDMPHFVRRDIFAFAKVILRLRHSDILFAINTRRANITRLKAVYHCEAIELAVRRIELKKALAIASAFFWSGWPKHNFTRCLDIYIALSAPLQELVNRLFYIKALDGVFPCLSSAILLDRMNLSARNGWSDEEGRVYIIFNIEEIKGALVIFRTRFEECLRMLTDRALPIGR